MDPLFFQLFSVYYILLYSISLHWLLIRVLDYYIDLLLNSLNFWFNLQFSMMLLILIGLGGNRRFLGPCVCCKKQERMR